MKQIYEYLQQNGAINPNHADVVPVVSIEKARKSLNVSTAILNMKTNRSYLINANNINKLIHPTSTIETIEGAFVDGNYYRKILYVNINEISSIEIIADGLKMEGNND